MHLSEQDIIEFQKLWKLETGEDITPEQAREYAMDVIDLVDFVIHKHPRARDPPE